MSDLSPYFNAVYLSISQANLWRWGGTCITRKKGRAGKGVTLVKGLNLDDEAMSALGKKLKAACGSGGTVKNGVVEVQGDHCDRLMSLLHEQGFIVKRAGG